MPAPAVRLADPAPTGDAHLRGLNEAQREAVLHGGGTPAGPLLVIAGAGSGKTNTLAHRVAHLLVHGADPQRILLLTFSRRAAVEMERRTGRVVQEALGGSGAQPPALPWSGTFHGIGARLLREYAERIGLDPQFTIHDRGDSEDLMALVRHELGLASGEQRFPAKATCLAIYSRAVNTQLPLGEVLAQAFTWCVPWESALRRLFAAYVEAKQAQNVLDFDDLLLYWAHMAEEQAIGAEIGARFDHVLVDEYQDTNRLQSRILLGLKPDGQGVTVVGDDAQSIYSFRAATVRNILEFPGSFAPAATVVTLERNYRSTEPILRASNAVIARARERFTKNLWTERRAGTPPELVTVRDETDQARCVAERVLEHRESGMALKQQAVLFRSSSHSAQLELELARRRIPYVKYGGLRFLEAAHVKDVLAVLRFAQNPRGRIAGFRALQLVAGVGPATASRTMEVLEHAADATTALAGIAIGAAAEEGWQEFAAMYRALRAAAAPWPASFELVLRWYETRIDTMYDDANVRLADLATLARIAGTYASQERFLTELTLDPPAASSDEAEAPGTDDDYLILSTIHSAKGQEWKSVHVLNVVDGCIPSDMATGSTEEIEEERRLLYVAMTRARDRLHLLVPQRFYVHQQSGQGDRHVYASRTRFIDDGIAAHFEQRAWPACAPAAGAGRVEEPRPRVDLAARLRASWS